MAESKADAPRATSNRSTVPGSDTFKHYISSNWAERTDALPAPREQAVFAAARRERISALHPGKRLIVPAGAAKVRSNDTDFPYRAHSAFAHLTGWGSDSEPDSVLVLEPTATGGTLLTSRREAPKGISDVSVRLTNLAMGGVDDFGAELKRDMATTLAKIKADAER